MTDVMIGGIFSLILIVVMLIYQIATAPHIKSDDSSELETDEYPEEVYESRKAEALREAAQHSLNLNMMAMDSLRRMNEAAERNREDHSAHGIFWYEDGSGDEADRRGK